MFFPILYRLIYSFFSLSLSIYPFLFPFLIFSLFLILHSSLPAFLSHTDIQKENETDVNLFVSLVPSNRQPYLLIGLRREAWTCQGSLWVQTSLWPGWQTESAQGGKSPFSLPCEVAVHLLRSFSENWYNGKKYRREPWCHGLLFLTKG